jgi:DNA-binding CsgD family transcriptional regulator
MTADTLEQGRRSFERQRWADAYAQLSAADRETPLEPEDLERLATAAYLVGKNTDGADILARAHHELLKQGEVARATRCAFWLGFQLLNEGEHARASGWLARARRLVDDLGHDCVEQGYLLVPVAFQSFVASDYPSAHTTFRQAAEIGERFNDADLTTLSRHGQGRALIRLGETDEGVALLDEVMVTVTTGEASSLIVGLVYCSVIEACREIFDLRRAQEWTAALTRWCESQPDLVPFRGECLVFRAEIMQLHGAWQEAIAEAQRACEWLSQAPDQAALGAAFYQRAELCRLRGAFAEAEEAYREAGKWLRRPRPGLAQLRLAQGQVDAAVAAIRRLRGEAQDSVARSKVLPAYVEIMLAAKDVQAARAAADELSAIADGLSTPLLHAVSNCGQGAVLLAEGNAQAALAALRQAWTAWQELEVPYEAARVRVLIGLACRELGDEDGAEMELDAARLAFQQLGAAPDLARVEALTGHAEDATHGLSPRELQVLRLLAAGETNKAIAAKLFISERTVERHVSNIFDKLGVSSRAAATAYAYEHGLV